MKQFIVLLLVLSSLSVSAQELTPPSEAQQSSLPNKIDEQRDENYASIPDNWFLYFSNGRAVIQRDSLYGFVDRNGVEVIPCRYTKAYCFNDGIAMVRDGYQNYAIDTLGNRLPYRIELPRFRNHDFGHFVSTMWRKIPFTSSDEYEQFKNTTLNAIITIDSDGAITACEPADEYPSELFARVYNAVMTSEKWTPARIDGQPRTVRYLLPVEFGKIRPKRCWAIDEAGNRIERDFVYPLFQGKYIDAFNDWLYTQMRFRTPEEYQRAQKGMVRALLTIDTKGVVRDIEVVHSHNEECRQLLVKALKKSPRWTAGSIDGKPVAVRYDISYYFNFR